MKYKEDVLRLYFKDGFTVKKIRGVIPVSDSTIRRWINFALENEWETIMNDRTDSIEERNELGRENNEVKTLLAEIRRLKKELDYQSLRADAYDELINVAEKQFNISIRKKAGVEQ